jgi:hypothetical protein
MPASCLFWDRLLHALEHVHQIRRIAPRIPVFILRSGLYTDITVREYKVPLGDWHTDVQMKHIGRTLKTVIVRYASGLKEVFRQAGLSQEEYETLVKNFVEEIDKVPGMVMIYHTVHARKI